MIIGYVVVLFANTINQTIAMGAAILGMAAAAYYLTITQKELKTLEGKYGVR